MTHLTTLATLAAALALATTAAQAEDILFRSPSGNIHCLVSDDPSYAGARCDIGEVDALSFARRPADCDLDWGRAFFVGERGSAEPICAGDTVVSPDATVLPYGRSVTLGAVTCESSKQGMECRNGSGGLFLLRRRSQIAQ